MKTSKTIGVLGGMGPYATVSFYQILLNLTKATKDWDHLHVIMDINPRIPSRSRHHLFGEASPVPAMIESCRRLESYPVDFIVIPCNSASHYLPEIEIAVEIPFINIIDVTSASVAELLPTIRKVAVLGGVITYEKATYRPFLAARQIEYCEHSLRIQRQVEQLIEAIKLNMKEAELREGFSQIINSIQNDCGAEAVILGCTELSIFRGLMTNVPIIDSSERLARAAIRMALD